MSSNGADEGRAAQVDDFLEDVGERLGLAVAGVGRTLKQWGGQLGGNDHRPAHERAEAIVSGIQERLADYTASLGHGIRRVAARAKEEIDDIRAEAEVKKGQWTAGEAQESSGGSARLAGE